MIFVQVLELQKNGVQLEWCQLVRYENSGTLRKPFDEPKVGYTLYNIQKLTLLLLVLFSQCVKVLITWLCEYIMT